MEWKMMSMGEVIDKFIILKVKCEKLTGEDYKMAKAQHDFILKGLERYAKSTHLSNIDKLTIIGLIWELHGNHRIQWEAEDEVLAATNAADGLRAAKKSRKYNLRRAEIKKKIDIIYGEQFLEVKDYASLEDLK